MVQTSALLGLSQRLPPSNLQAEQALLGALLANNRALQRVVDYLLPTHFADPVHGRIYRAILERILEGQVADAVTLKAEFEHSGILDEVGGAPYLAQLLASMVSVMSAAEYGRAIYETWIRRQLIEIGEHMINSAFGAGDELPPPAQISAAEMALSKLGGSERRGDKVVSFGTAFAATLEQLDSIYRSGRSPAVVTGMAAVDAAIGGFWPKTLTLLAGVPKSGKTALAVQIAESIAERLYDDVILDGRSASAAAAQPGVVIFSMEMTAEELTQRSAARRLKLPLHKLRRGEIDMVTGTELIRVNARVNGLPIRIHDCRKMPLRLLAAKVRMHLQRQPEVLVIVDHLLILGDDDEGNKTRGGQDAATVAKAASDLKTLAHETGLPFLVLTHASRASGRLNTRPVASDVKWAGEGDADTVVFVHRPIMGMDSTEPTQGPKEGKLAFGERHQRWQAQKDEMAELAEIVVAANRQGPTGVWRMRFRGETTSFHEWQETAHVPDLVPDWVLGE